MEWCCCFSATPGSVENAAFGDARFASFDQWHVRSVLCVQRYNVSRCSHQPRQKKTTSSLNSEGDLMNEHEKKNEYSTTLTVAEPDTNQQEEGFQNQLCECSGQALPPGANANLIPCEIHIIAQDANVETPGRDCFDPVNNPKHISHDISNQPSSEWNVDGVYCNDQRDPTDNNSAVFVRAMWADAKAWPPAPVFDPNPDVSNWIPRRYMAKTVPSCGGEAPTIASLFQSSSSASRLAKAQDVNAVSYVDGCLSFCLLEAATARHNPLGFRLMVNDAPLRTSAIRVATSNVSIGYAYGQRKFMSYRPSGPTLTASHEVLFGNLRAFAFHRLPIWALFVWQGDPQHAHVLLSQSTESPDVIGLDPCQDVFVQINYHRLFAVSGTFGLHVGPAF